MRPWLINSMQTKFEYYC